MIPLKLSKRLEFWLIGVMLAAFALSVMDDSSEVVLLFGNIKWYFFIMFFIVLFIVNMRRLKKINDIVPALFLGFVVLLTLSTALNSSAFDDGPLRILSFWILYAIAFIVPSPPDPYARLTYWTSACLLICAVIVVSSSIDVASQGMFLRGRLYGITSHPNALGTFSAMLLAGSLGQILCGRTRWINQLGWWCLMLLAGGLLLLTQSRTALLAAIASILVLLVVKKKWLLLAIFTGVTISYLAFTYFSNVTTSAKVTQKTNVVMVRQFGLENRISIWMKQVDAWFQSPLIGSGLEIKPDHGRPGGEGSYTDLLAAAGLLGGLPFFLGLLMGFILLFRQAAGASAGAPSKALSDHQLSALGVVTVIMVNSVGEGYLAQVGTLQPIYLWVVIGAACHIKRMTFRSYAPQRILSQRQSVRL